MRARKQLASAAYFPRGYALKVGGHETVWKSLKTWRSDCRFNDRTV